MAGFIDVWSEKPIMLKDFDGPQVHVWVGSSEYWLLHKLTILTVEECGSLYGVGPDHVGQLIMTPTYRLPKIRKAKK